MLEIRAKKSETYPFESAELYFKDRLIPNVDVSASNYPKGKFDLFLEFNEFCIELLKETPDFLKEIFELVSKIKISGVLEWLDSKFFESFVDLDFYKWSNRDVNSIGLELSFAIQPKPADWSLPFSINYYTGRFIEVVEKLSEIDCELNTYVEPYDIALTITYSIDDFNGSILEEIKRTSEVIKISHNRTFNFLLEEAKHSLLTSFNFPEVLKTPCEQYLLYFAKFLQDLGINAISNIKEEAGKVLFSVTPTDDVEALDKIREALAVYLNLPSSPIVYDDSFAAMRLRQQVDNLQHAQRMAEMEVRSSLYAIRLANQTIEHQDKIIQQKDTTIEQQNRVIERITDKAVMINSAENKEELEKIYEGIEVGESETLRKWLGIKLNPAKVVKAAVNNVLGKGDEIIELGLDKE